jgi:hypothetical protein
MQMHEHQTDTPHSSQQLPGTQQQARDCVSNPALTPTQLRQAQHFVFARLPLARSHTPLPCGKRLAVPALCTSNPAACTALLHVWAAASAACHASPRPSCNTAPVAPAAAAGCVCLAAQRCISHGLSKLKSRSACSSSCCAAAGLLALHLPGALQ